ncbi:neurogenic locus notch homolog protein 3-like [Onthophagus taurus]|uniref:neurogenic locus notch homolog protein 3-like n=1 Tax=Onthophagus taurus TaxID=166361 RepID=UPI000C20F659|nr:uncharacterized protein LOC111428532 [Onthophagus taurus]
MLVVALQVTLTDKNAFFCVLSAMRKVGNMFYSLLVLLLFISQVTSECDTSQKRLGCRIQGKRCTCDEFSCTSEYRYSSFEECDSALRGKRADICHPNPCMHGGSCIQVAQQPGFKCRCEGTGFYGERCNRACPRPTIPYRDIIFPYECIVI